MTQTISGPQETSWQQTATIPNTIPEIQLELKAAVLKVTNLKHLNIDTIDANSPLFQGGLGMDSIDLLELIVHVDRRFGLKLRNDDSGRNSLQSIASLADAIAEHLNSPGLATI